MPGCTPVTTVGWKKVPTPSTTAPSDRHARATRGGIRDQRPRLLHGIRIDQRADGHALPRYHGRSFIAETRSVTRRANSSATDSCTRNRFAAVQASPMFRNMASIAPVDRLVEVGILEHQNGAFPPSSIDVRSTPLGGLDQQAPPTLGRAGEAELAQTRIADDRLAHRAGGRGRDDVDDAGGQPDLLEQPRESAAW